MSELPRTDDPPLEAERLEEAFAVFTERVRELESVADELRAELRALRTERASAPRFEVDEPFEVDEEVWPVESASASAPPAASADWVAAVPSPLARPTATPRLVLEGGFLVLVALLAGLADLSAAWIVLVMTGAWALVALSEWVVAAKRARWRLDGIAAPVGDGAAETTGPWDLPVVQATVVEAPDESESHTVIAKLPAEPEVAEEPEAGEPEVASEPEVAGEAEDVIEPSAKARRGLRFWRRAPAEPAPDPREA